MDDKPYLDEVRPVAQQYELKKVELGLTQEKIAAQLGVTQGLVGHWLQGRTRIPDDSLLALAVMLGFNPVTVRPEISSLLRSAAQVLGKQRETLIYQMIDALPADEQDQALSYLRFLGEQSRNTPQ